MIAGIILAAGKGTRINSKDKNKVTLPFLNKPLIIYGVELMLGIADPVVVVVGAFHKSVREVLKNYRVVFAKQNKRLGTAHAVKVGLEKLNNYKHLPKTVLVAYGDHTMFYKKEIVKDLINLHEKEKASISLITSSHPDIDSFAWGRILRDGKKNVVGIVEQKDATLTQRKIKEFNPGFYCFDFEFLKNNMDKIKKSSISGEYYITDLIQIAVEQGKKVVALKVPFSIVGIGINRNNELEESQKLYLQRKE